MGSKADEIFEYMVTAYRQGTLKDSLMEKLLIAFSTGREFAMNEGLVLVFKMVKEVALKETNEQEIFELMAAAHKQGVMDKFLTAFNKGLEAALEEGRLTMWEVTNMLDEVEEVAMVSGNSLLEKAGPLLKYIKSEKMMKLTSRLLDLKPVNQLIIDYAKKMILENREADAQKETLLFETGINDEPMAQSAIIDN